MLLNMKSSQLFRRVSCQNNKYVARFKTNDWFIIYKISSFCDASPWYFSSFRINSNLCTDFACTMFFSYVRMCPPPSKYSAFLYDIQYALLHLRRLSFEHLFTWLASNMIGRHITGANMHKISKLHQSNIVINSIYFAKR